MNLISLKKYAELHNVDASTVRYKILNGNLKAIKIGNSWAINKDEPYIDLRFKENRKSDRLKKKE